MDQIDSVLAGATLASFLVGQIMQGRNIAWYYQPAIGWGCLTLLTHVVFG